MSLVQRVAALTVPLAAEVQRHAEGSFSSLALSLPGYAGAQHQMAWRV